jgi:outer membrane protein W
MKLQSLFTAVLLCLCSIASHAQTIDLTLYGSQLQSTGTTVPHPDGSFAVDFSNDLGLGLSVAFRIGRAHDIEVAMFRFEPDLRVTFEGETLTLGSVQTDVITAMVRRRFRPGQRLQPILGAGVGYVPRTEVRRIDSEQRGGLEDEIELVGSFGFDFAITNRTGLIFDARWMPIDLRFRNAEADAVPLTFDPLILSAGVRFRF